MRHGSSIMILKQSSRQVSGSWVIHPLQNKARMSRYMVKQYVYNVVNIKGVSLSHAVPKESQSISCIIQRFFAIISWTLSRKRPEGYDGVFILHQDNAPAHASQDVQTTIKIQLEAEILTHPPYFWMNILETETFFGDDNVPLTL